MILEKRQNPVKTVFTTVPAEIGFCQQNANPGGHGFGDI